MNLVMGCKRASVTVLSYKSGLMTEFIGRIMIENTGYHPDASITPPKCRKQTTVNGIQHKKSVSMMAEILACSFLFLARRRLLGSAMFLVEFDVFRCIITYEMEMITKQIKLTARVIRV